MPKAKLVVPMTDLKKVRVAAEFSDVIVLPNAKKIGDEVHIVLSTPQTANYIKFGKYLAVVTGNEISDEPEPAKQAKEAKETK